MPDDVPSGAGMKRCRARKTQAELLVTGMISRAEERLRAAGIDVDLVTLMDEVPELAESLHSWLDGQPWARAARPKLLVEVDLMKPGPVIVEDILRVAYEKELGGPVAQHLVGAKLARRFPDKKINNFPYTTADIQLGPDGDFTVENTAFHVTVAPTLAHLNKCGQSIKQGRKPYLIVPAAQISKARAYAEAEKVDDKTAITSIEQFVGQNVDEMGEFGQAKTKTEIAAVLTEYNRRVAEVENDQSIQIIIPKNVAER
jgi:hypothetical protein